MKGTLFSADFVNDSSNNLRLLELNTDTTIVHDEVVNLDWTTFISVLSENSLDTVDIIYKPAIHTSIVNHLKSTLESNAPFITSINLHDEDGGVIYPISIVETGTNFILRLAYDESAILDSEYCKSRLNVYKLFNDAGYTNYTTAIYSSSSLDGVYNTLTASLNPDNVPDIAVHDKVVTFNPIDFYKIGSEVENESVEDRFNQFILENKDENKIIEQYHFHSSSLDVDGKITTVRSVNIVYGSELQIIPLLSYRISALFDLPSSISSEVLPNFYTSKIADHHFYEYATNYMKVGNKGILSDNKVKLADGSWEYISNIAVGQEIQSYFISGSPQVESDKTVLEWGYSGSTLPVGSYLTSSVVVFKDTSRLKYGALLEFVVDGDSIFSGIGKTYLTYNSSSNYTSFKSIYDINPTVDYFFDISGSLIDVDEVNLYLTSDTTLEFVELDVEDTDTYIISGSTAFNSVVSHNAPCFVAGTQITMADGSIKNIEDVAAGESVLTFNHETNTNEVKKVYNVIAKKVDRTVLYEFEDGKTLEATVDHPLYSPQEGYVSFDPGATELMYGMKVSSIEIGTSIMQEDKTELKVVKINLKVDNSPTVYNLHSVEDNHNFYANSLLVHNRCFSSDSKVEMFDGSFKPIIQVTVGDIVKSVYKDQIVPGTVTDVVEHPVQDVIPVTLINNIVADPDHPMLYNGKWVPAKTLPDASSATEFIDTFYNLEIDGQKEESEHNFFIGGYAASGLGDNKKLNFKYQRQPLEMLKHL